jgi:excisionase family DNA binding protein
MTRPTVGAIEKLLTLDEVAVVLNTASTRFPRRLIAERRIRYVHVGRFVRIPESALAEFIANGTVEPRPARGIRRAA